MSNKHKIKFKCPFCGSKSIIKQGKRKNKLQIIQKYKCKSCNKHFTLKNIKHKTFPPNIILNAVSYYNLGYSQNQVSKLIGSRFKIKVPQRTISHWISGYRNMCTYHRLRKRAIKLYKPKEIIFSQKLQHKQIYNFQLHKAKLLFQSKELPEQKFRLLKLYLERIPSKDFPHHIFTMSDEILEQRASQLNMKLLKVTKLNKRNLANQLAELGLMLAKTNRERHPCIQDFMLINDSTTIATEVPVYLTNDDINYFKNHGFTFDFRNYRTPITGHIDILQIKNDLIHILDYKPKARKVKPIEQLTIYALGLASRTKLAVKDFKCAWFDQNHYFEFFPLHAVYKKRL